MPKRIAFTFSFFFLLSSIFAQVDFSASNLLRYGSGERSIGFLKNSFVYRENLTDLKLRWLNDVTFGTRILYDNPPETGKKFIGISRKFISYKNDNFEIRLGNSSELFGKGLAVNLFENRALAYDTWLDGIKAKYNFDNLIISGLYGRIKFTDSTNFYRTEDYLISAANAEYKPGKIFSFGFSFVNANGKIPLPQINYELKAEVAELFFSLHTSNFNYFFDYSHKWTGVKEGESSKGFGIYSALGYNNKGFGLTIEYKNYIYDERNPYERYDFTRPTRLLPFQNPPTVVKEHSYLFLSRSIHEVDFNDEVGLQLEMFYELNDDTHINFNLSTASRHNFYDYNRNNFQFDKKIRPRNFFPSFDDKYSPFNEGYLEIEQVLNESITVNFGAAHRTKTTYNDISGIIGSHRIRSTVIPLIYQHRISDGYSATVQYEFESVYDNFNSGQNRYYNQMISLLSNFFSKYILGLRYEFTDNNNNVSGRRD